jgi:hypothetical protein
MRKMSVVIRELIYGKLYYMDDYYGIPGLCELALQRIKVDRDVVH